VIKISKNNKHTELDTTHNWPEFNFTRTKRIGRRRIIITIIIAFILTLIISSIGSSRTENFSNTEEEIDLQDSPQGLQGIPSMNNTNFNWTRDFNELNNGSIPGAGLQNLTDIGNIGDIDEIIGINPNDTLNLPDLGDPNLGDPNIPNIQPPGQIDVNPPDSNIDPDNGFGDGSTDPGTNRFLPENRENKARNLPSFGINLKEIFDKLKTKLPDVSNFKISQQSIIILTTFMLIIYVKNQFLPNLLRDIQEGPSMTSNQLFIKSKKEKTDKNYQRERERRLLMFKDHIIEITLRCKSRLEKEGHSSVIIDGYQELDHAFALFTRLKRQIGDTPLEHALKHFESGEISNFHLSGIVELFYQIRYGHKELERQHGVEFINHLENLIISTNIDDVQEHKDSPSLTGIEE